MAISTTVQGSLFHVGDIVRVNQRIMEGDKERLQIYEGMVIGIRGRGENQSFTVRKIATGNIGVEKVFPSNSPWIAKVDIKKTGSVRRAKLTYVRTKSSRQVAHITQGNN